VVEIIGTVKLEPNIKQEHLNGVEIVAESINILSEAETLPFPINREDGMVPFNTLNLFRPLTLRKEKERCIFKIQSETIYAYRDFLRSKGFTEINSTKLSAAGLEGGAEMFETDYFGNKMFLTQSPQFYKQMMVGAFEKVFEVGKVYRAEGSDSPFHMCEYIGLDLEMGFINSVHDVMDVEEALMNRILCHLEKTCQSELKYLEVDISSIYTSTYSHKRIPRITYKEALSIFEDITNKKATTVNKEVERFIGEYFMEKEGSYFVFITHYPSNERPFYSMPSKEEGLTETFDLLYKGVEITSGGQRIHGYKQLIESIQSKGLNPENFESYLMPFKYGMPPHGGLGIGLEIKEYL
jgi:nondiscriminating aspartyl-tRNA synthetase